MKIAAILLNLPWTLGGLLAAFLSFPYKVAIYKTPPAVIFYGKSFWWYSWLPDKKKVRAIASGNIVIMGPLEREGDLEHELIHVEQYMREPFVHRFKYILESRKKGYRENKYEVEAYERAGNTYEKE